MCRMCSKVPESLANVLARLSSLAQTKYMERHNAALKVLFFAMLRDLKLACSSMVLTGGAQRCTSQKTLKHTGMFQFTQSTLSFQPTGCTRDLETTSRLGCWLSCLWVCNCAKKYSSKTAREVPTTAVGAYQTVPRL